jgi:cytochrome c-type protein NapB
MRGQDRARVTGLYLAVAGAVLGSSLVFVAAAFSEGTAPNVVPRLTGYAQPMSAYQTAPFARPITDDQRKMRNYPEQPPVIPHSIENYQLTVNTNRCLDCHRRQYTEASGAPMISVTHFMDRDGQILADVTPRRYFCTECHVQQTDAKPLVPNTFEDMSAIGSGSSERRR